MMSIFIGDVGSMIEIKFTGSLTERINSLRNQSDSEIQIKTKKVIQDYYTKIFLNRSSNGKSWGVDADGKPITLVQSGALRSNLINLPYFSMYGNRITISTGLDYAKFVDERFNILDLDEETKRKIQKIYLSKVIAVFSDRIIYEI
jgi:hypothetical protein